MGLIIGARAHFDLSLRQISAKELATAVSTNPGARSIALGAIQGRDWSCLSALPRLEVLHAMPWKHPTFEPLRSLRRLREVALNIYGRAADLTPLSELSRLEELELWTEHVHDLSPLRACKKLRILRIGPVLPEARPWVKSFAPLGDLRSLRVVGVAGAPRRDGLRPFAKMRWLRRLDIDDFAPPEECGWLAAHLPRTRGTATSPYTLMRNMLCRKCGRPRALLHGKATVHWACPHCSTLLEKHSARFEAGRANELRRMGLG